jgi:P4 family phage/plasmid primase-like protien
MADIIKLNPNKVRRYHTLVETYLNNFRVGSGANIKHTHIAMGETFTGKFCLNEENIKEFTKLYCDAIQYGIILNIAEKPKDYGPILIDIDLEIPNENYNDGRLYDDKIILSVIDAYINSIKMYLDVDCSELEVSVLEKPSTTLKGSIVKDGIHLIFHNICAHYKLRHLIRYHAIKILIENETFINFTKPVETIIDLSVVSKNDWLMYGSAKKGGTATYKLTKIYAPDKKNNNEYCELDITNFLNNSEKLIFMYSLQQKEWTADNTNALLEDVEFIDIEADYARYCEKTVKNYSISLDDFIPPNKENEIRKAKFLVSILSPDRNNTFEQWIRVGWALHNIDRCLLNTWIEFSRQSPKFKEGECEQLWPKMKEGLTIRSLMFWAEEDNYHKYHEFMKNEFNEILKKSLDGSTFNIAKALHAKYMNRFICASPKHNTWYEFKNHRWVKIQDAYTLKKEISEGFVQEYYDMLKKLIERRNDSTDFDKQEIQEKIERVTKITSKLLDSSFKDKIMKESSTIFYDCEFEEKLDENIDLIGFNNGVYDLANYEFREGRPDDWISLSTKVDYYPYNPKNPNSPKMLKFLREILPNENVRQYFLLSLAMCVAGHNVQKLNIATGSGGNGKSILFNLVKLALGQYFITMPITVFTRKRGSAGTATPELARMKGARCACSSETDHDEQLSVGIMKELTGGDSIMVRNLFSDPIEVKPQLKFFMLCNTLPTVPSTDQGTWRRIRVIEFSSEFVDTPIKPNQFLADSELEGKVKEWAELFASYLIDLYVNNHKLHKMKIAEPQEVLYSTNSYKMENDHFTEYFNHRIVVTNSKKDTISIKSMFEDFKAWYKHIYDKSKKVITQTDLVKYMKDKIGEPINLKWKCVVFNNGNDEDSNTGSDNETVEKSALDI